ncbi:MAG: hypothetical protein K2K24_00480 [Clostridia bacterium]|nr:hypothetical protein [Clostridia bacterium]
MRVYLSNRKDVYVFHNGEALDIMRHKGKEYVEFDVPEGEEYTLEFVKKSEFSRPMWFVYAIVFWIIGVMGFFTPKFNKNTFSLNCKMTAKAKSQPLILFFNLSNPKYAPNVAIKVVGEGEVLLEDEKYVEDKTAKFRRKVYSFLSGITRLAIIVIIAVAIIKKIIG